MYGARRPRAAGRVALLLALTGLMAGSMSGGRQIRRIETGRALASPKRCSERRQPRQPVERGDVPTFVEPW